MKYSIESIPQLIGEQDFKDLCLAVGIAEGEEVTGRDLAEVVRSHVVIALEKAEKAREQLRQRGLA
ncbi:hypothetical protein G6L12_08210 [Agrobacterium rhizogenes]|nr:hypothetical protein [Rhizobium rhizogenes]NTF74456.1 hypothetical protein [Rhizobium rhizogenes]